MKSINFLLFIFSWIFICTGFSAIALTNDEISSVETRIKEVLEEKKLISDKENIFYRIQLQLDNKTKNILSNDKMKDVSINYVDQQKNTFKAMIYFTNSKEVLIQGNIVEYINLPVLKNKIARGYQIKEEDIMSIAFRMDKLPPDVAKYDYEVIGQVLKSAFSPRVPIKLNNLSSPQVIHKKDLVNVMYHKGFITLTMSAIALDEGGVGDSIRIKNTRSNQIIMGKIQNNKLVVIE